MSPSRRSTALAASMFVIFCACMVAAQILAILNGNFRLNDQTLMLAFLAFMGVGALIVSRRPENTIGWIFSAVGLVASTGVLAMEYAEFAFVTQHAALPGRIWAAWYAAWFWFPLLGLCLLFPLLLFPSGKPLSTRWRPLVWVSAVATAGITILSTLNPSYRLQNEDLVVSNPIGVSGIGNVEESPAGSFLYVVFIACLLLAAIQLFVRFRRSVDVERQQLKMFTYAGAVVALLAAVEVPDALWGLAVAMVPVAAGFAILRYRLYDIDRVINKTIVYVIVTASVVAVYAATVFVASSLVAGSGDSFTIALATLAAAAVFRPLLRRVQGFVDKRFFRRKYDAATIIGAFGDRLRNEVDLNDLTEDLVAVVSTTMQPEHVSLWLRRGPADSVGSLASPR
jgi:MFS family permease